jgi:hypothetical protein
MIKFEFSENICPAIYYLRINFLKLVMGHIKLVTGYDKKLNFF